MPRGVAVSLAAAYPVALLKGYRPGRDRWVGWLHDLHQWAQHQGAEERQYAEAMAAYWSRRAQGIAEPEPRRVAAPRRPRLTVEILLALRWVAPILRTPETEEGIRWLLEMR